MRVDAIIGFEQTDENQYVLTIRGEVPNHVHLWMDTMDAVRLHSLLRNELGEYIAEMEEAKHSVRVDHFACDDPEHDYGEMVREWGDQLNKQRKESP